MAGYSKELVVGAFLHRFRLYGLSSPEHAEWAASWYDKMGKDKFREYGCVTPEAIRIYKQFIKENKTYA